MHCRELIALVMVCAYLILPLESFASLDHTFSPALHNGASVLEIASANDDSSRCPCSDQGSPDGCNLTCSCCSCCSFFAPSHSGIVCILTTTPLLMPEPFQRFPQVYLAIFVPPQNRA